MSTSSRAIVKRSSADRSAAELPCAFAAGEWSGTDRRFLDCGTANASVL